MRQTWIVDASVAIKWVLEEDDSDRALTVAGDRLLAPASLAIECANILWKAVGRGELSSSEALERLEGLRLDAVEVIPQDILLRGALMRGMRHRHAVYDCLYLEAAARTGHPLLTADRRLAGLADGGARVVLLSDLPA